MDSLGRDIPSSTLALIDCNRDVREPTVGIQSQLNYYVVAAAAPGMRPGEPWDRRRAGMVSPYFLKAWDLDELCAGYVSVHVIL